MIKVQIGTLTEKVKSLEILTKELEEKVMGLEAIRDDDQKQLKSYQSQLKSANENIVTLTNELRITTDSRNDYRRRYEDWLKLNIIQLIIKKLRR